MFAEQNDVNKEKTTNEDQLLQSQMKMEFLRCLAAVKGKEAVFYMHTISPKTGTIEAVNTNMDFAVSDFKSPLGTFNAILRGNDVISVNVDMNPKETKPKSVKD